MTKRDRLARVMGDLDKIMQEPGISPTPYSHLRTALFECQKAGQFVLDVNEQDGVKP